MAFRQGDDEAKRKGELNVLMSRPKKRAYHYIHGGFQSLDHQSCSIADYLWRTYQSQSEKEKVTEILPRKHRPEKDFIPWRRYSGQLMLTLLEYSFQTSGIDPNILGTPHFSITVGNPQQKVDLMLLPDKRDAKGHSIGIIDLCGFDVHGKVGQEIVDYYFQLQRAAPKVKPIFVFIHEIVSKESSSFKILKSSMKRVA